MAQRIYFSGLLVSFAAALTQAQNGSIAGPSSGLVFDRASQSVRPIRGVPGAATMGDSVDAGFPLASAYVSPAQDSMFAIAVSGGVHYYNAKTGGMAETAIGGMLDTPERVIFSPSGTAAALYSRGRVQMITGLPASPVAAEPFTVNLTVHSQRPGMTSLTVSDDGVYLLLVAGGSLRLVSAAQGDRSVMDVEFGASAAFAPGGHDAAVVARGTGVVLIRDVPNAAARRTLAADDDAFTAVAGLAFSADGRSLYLASASAKSVVSLNAASGARTDIVCDCAPAAMVRMGNVYRLNELSTEPLWLFDAGATAPRIVFVPALKAGL